MINPGFIGSKAVLKVKVLGYELSFNYERSSNLDAELLYRKIQQQMDDCIEEIRKESYEAGYKDGKTHARKKTTFYCSMETGKGVGY